MSTIPEAANSESSLDYSHESQDNPKYGTDDVNQDAVLNWKERAMQLEKGKQMPIALKTLLCCISSYV